MKRYLQNGSQNRQFSTGRPFTSRGLLIQKSVFWTGVSDVGMFLQNWLIHWFQLIADALTMPPKKCVPGAAEQWQNGRKSVRRRRRRRTRYGHTYLSVAHTKCPSGNYFPTNTPNPGFWQTNFLSVQLKLEFDLHKRQYFLLEPIIKRYTLKRVALRSFCVNDA